MNCGLSGDDITQLMRVMNLLVGGLSGAYLIVVVYRVFLRKQLREIEIRELQQSERDLIISNYVPGMIKPDLAYYDADYPVTKIKVDVPPIFSMEEAVALLKTPVLAALGGACAASFGLEMMRAAGTLTQSFGLFLIIVGAQVLYGAARMGAVGGIHLQEINLPQSSISPNRSMRRRRYRRVPRAKAVG